jgi:N-glycosylase/DNA lyase
MKTTLLLASPTDFHLRHTVMSHGWRELPPFHVDETGTLRRVLHLPSGKIVVTCVTENDGSLILESEHKQKLTARDEAEIKHQISDCLRLNESYETFYSVVTKHKQFAWVGNIRAGRLLRGPTVFEDIVKMLCTTNCNWGATEKMVKSLVRTRGTKYADDLYTFPTPKQLEGVTEEFLRDEIRMGYRAAYLIELVDAINNGNLDVESWKHSTLSTPELYKELRKIKGIGEYAAGNILKLLGRYDYLAIDSWCRMKFSQLRKRGEPVEDKAIAAYYAKYKEWQGLFMWLDVTKDWYDLD